MLTSTSIVETSIAFVAYHTINDDLQLILPSGFGNIALEHLRGQGLSEGLRHARVRGGLADTPHARVCLAVFTFHLAVHALSLVLDEEAVAHGFLGRHQRDQTENEQ